MAFVVKVEVVLVRPGSSPAREERQLRLLVRSGGSRPLQHPGHRKKRRPGWWQPYLTTSPLLDFCSSSLPLASTREVRLTLSNLFPCVLISVFNKSRHHQAIHSWEWEEFAALPPY